MSARLERLLLVLTPALAIATVGVGLRIGAGEAVRAPVVTGVVPAASAAGLPWQLLVEDEDLGVRIPVPYITMDVTATVAGTAAHWSGPTNEDGVAEMFLPVPQGPVSLEVRSAGRLLARGIAAPAPTSGSEPRPSLTAWATFARRVGDVALDVAVMGQRGASGFPANLWVKASDRATHAPLPGVAIALDPDASLTSATTTAITDARGWAAIVATPMGYSVPLVLHATSSGGLHGEWAGGLFISPGAAEIVSKPVYRPDENVTFDVVVPTLRTTAYVEIDDASGRAWAAALPLAPPQTAAPRAAATGPKLQPGLYWIATAGDLAGTAALGPGTMARPFFVAASTDAALAFGTDPQTCAPTGDVRDGARVVAECLALVSPVPAKRWTALDGFAYQHERDTVARALGMRIGLGAIVLAVLLETLLLLRMAAAARAALRRAQDETAADAPRLVGRLSGVVVAVLVALLGFALLGAFLVRAA